MHSKASLTVLLSVLFFTVSWTATAQLASNWKIIPGGTVKSLRDVSSIGTDTLFVIDESGEIFSTFNAGNTWTKSTPQTGKELKFYAIRANEDRGTILAAGSQNAVFRSEDMGKSWEQTFFGSVSTPVSLFSISDDGSNYDKQTVYVAGENGTLLKSLDDGRSWEKKDPPVGIDDDCNLVSFLNPDTGFVAYSKGIILTFDGGKSWKEVSNETGIRALKARSKFKAGKALADVVKMIGSSGDGIQTSTDYGAAWTKDEMENSCALLGTGGVSLSQSECEELQNGSLVQTGTDGKSLFMMAGNTFRGVLQPKWENVNLENILMVMRTTDDHTVIAESLTDKVGRFDLEIPSSFIGHVEIVSLEALDPEFCPRPLPFDFDTTMEPMEECDELTTLQLRIAGAGPGELNDLTFTGEGWIAVGNDGLVLDSTDPDDDGDGLGDVWMKENSRTNNDLLTVSARGIEKSDIRRGFAAAGAAGTVGITQSPGFEVITPAGGGSLCAGSEVTIEWTGGEPGWNVVVYVIDVNSWSVAAVVSASSANDGNEPWTVPSNFSPGVYQVYIQEENMLTWTYGATFTVNYCPTNTACLEACPDNILLNWNFNENAVFGPMAWGSVSDWTNSGSPDVSTISCNSEDTVSIGMWGNQIQGESIFQSLQTPFTPGKTYSVSFMGKWHTIPNRPNPVQFEFRAYNTIMNSSVIIGVSAPLTVPGDWVIMSLPDWTATGSVADPFSVISVHATNHSSSLQADSTSYGIIGAICITEEITTDVQSKTVNADSGFELGQCFPNPFSQATTIAYTVPVPEHITIRVFNAQGKGIKTLVDQRIMPGNHQIEWNASGLPAGIYFYRMQAGNFMKMRKMVIKE